MAGSPIKKRLWAVFKATILGAVLADSPIVLLNVLDYFGVARHGTDPGYGLLYSIAIILSIPAAMFSDEHGLANPYVVNGAIGAIIFAAFAGFWQFVIKADPQKKAGHHDVV